MKKISSDLPQYGKEIIVFGIREPGIIPGCTIGKPSYLEHACQAASVMSHSATLWTTAYQAPLCPWDSPGENTGVGWHALLQEIFRPRDQTQVFGDSCTGRQVLYNLCHLGSPLSLWHLFFFFFVFKMIMIQPSSSYL